MTVTVAMLLLRAAALLRGPKIPILTQLTPHSHKLFVLSNPSLGPAAAHRPSTSSTPTAVSVRHLSTPNTHYTLTWSASVDDDGLSCPRGLQEASCNPVQVVAAIREYDALRQLIRSSSLLIRSSSVSLIPPPFCVWLVRISLGLSQQEPQQAQMV